MRLFISIELPDEIKQMLRQAQDELRPIIKAKWIAPEQLHLTLKFLGETPDEQLPRITDALRRIEFDRPLRLHTGGIGCFPPHGAIRIIAAGLRDDAGGCGLLQSRIDNACHGAGFTLDGRRWTPHVTIGRVKERAAGAARSAVTSVVRPLADFEIDEFQLMESRLDQKGPTYVCVARFPAHSGDRGMG